MKLTEKELQSLRIKTIDANPGKDYWSDEDMDFIAQAAVDLVIKKLISQGTLYETL